MRRSPGVVAGAGYSSPDNVAVSTRRTFVSRTMCRFRYANDAIAPAVYSPTPGSDHRSSVRLRHHAVEVLFDRRRGRVQPLRTPRVPETPPGPHGLARRRCRQRRGVGHRRSQASYTGSTRATGVC